MGRRHALSQRPRVELPAALEDQFPHPGGWPRNTPDPAQSPEAAAQCRTPPMTRPIWGVRANRALLAILKESEADRNLECISSAPSLGVSVDSHARVATV